MKSQKYFLGKNKKKNIVNLFSAEFSERVVSLRKMEITFAKRCSDCDQ